MRKVWIKWAFSGHKLFHKQLIFEKLFLIIIRLSASTVNDRFSGNDHFSGQIMRTTTVLEENEPVLFTGLEDTTALEDKKGLTVFSAKSVVHCIGSADLNELCRLLMGH